MSESNGVQDEAKGGACEAMDARSIRSDLELELAGVGVNALITSASARIAKM
jgi:hypothetical protein